MNLIYFLFPLILASTVPLTIVAIGALYSERSGVVNIALEGIMIMGGFVGILTMRGLEGTGLTPQMIALIGLTIGAIIGLIFSILHAYASINIKANQIISATALNMLAPAIAIFVARTINEDSSKRVVLRSSYRIAEVPLLSDIPIIGDLFFKGAYLSTYLGVIILVAATIILYKTRLGLRIRSCGENPHAADSLGVNIYKIRYIGVLVSGAMAGMGGVIFVLSFATRFDASVAGFGFLSLAVLIFGQWHPKKILYAALFFATMQVIGSTYSGIPVLDSLPIPSQLYSMLPYVATLIALAFASKNSRAPRAAGEPYDPGKR
ncbi:MAG: ABC transporter permease [Candidatus Izemoplasmataceae bacterium]